MKRKNYFRILLFFELFLLASCNSNVIDESSRVNYWTTSTLVRLHLNGKVKTITYSDGSQVEEFNQDGFITKSTYTSTDGMSVTVYNYAATGELTSTDFSSSMGGSISYSSTFQYDNSGNYVVQHPYHILMNGLVPNLKSSVTNGGRVDYVFQGSTMLMINSFNTSKDTVIVKYNGKYPVSISNGTSFIKDMTYAEDGMFRTYTEGFQSADYYTETKYVFKPDLKFQLIDSVVYKTINQSVTQTSVDRYTYDANRNIQTMVSNGTYTEYTYGYDPYGNWTTKTAKSKPVGASAWTNTLTESRTFTYW